MGSSVYQTFITGSLDQPEEADLLISVEPNSKGRLYGLQAAGRSVHEVLVRVVAIDEHLTRALQESGDTIRGASGHRPLLGACLKHLDRHAYWLTMLINVTSADE